jgi:hypothetical protein
MLHGLKGQTTTRLRDYALAFEDLIASFMLELSKARPRRAEVIAAFCKATFEHDPSVVMECARRYAALDFAGHDDPLMLLHLRLIEGISSRHSRGSPIYPYAVTAIRASAKGRSLRKLVAAERDFVIRGPTTALPTQEARPHETRPRFPTSGS